MAKKKAQHSISIARTPSSDTLVWGGRIHPTQKPVELLAQLIAASTKEGDTVLDPFMGSGTTAIAAIREKRNFIGFELYKEYYEKACKRIKLELAQSTLF